LAIFPENALVEPAPAEPVEAPEKITEEDEKGKKKAKAEKAKKDTKGKKKAKAKKGKKETKGKETSMAKKKKNKKDKKKQNMKREEFEKQLRPLHVELVKMQEWVKATGAKICIVFEGRDTAGKGGTIQRIVRRVSPRVFRVVALPAPTDREKSQMYFQRYMSHLPAAGEVVIFDRSWYNRAGVEPVMGFATPEEVEYFLKAVPLMERAIINSGILLIKYWLEVDMEVQDERLRARDEDPRKIWKLSPMDLKSYSHWYDYSRARDAMFAATDTPWSPWYVVDANIKRRARLNCISHLLSIVPYEEVPREPVKFPKRQKRGDYREPDYPYRYIPNKY
jgi:polyphosphate kinase 2